MTLADGSEVTMDLATEIDVRLSRGERNIKLVAGRALFDVAHDASRPFRVDTGHGKVTALGTQFQVDVDTDQVIVTLLEGSVSVSPPESASARADAATRARPAGALLMLERSMGPA